MKKNLVVGSSPTNRALAAAWATQARSSPAGKATQKKNTPRLNAAGIRTVEEETPPKPAPLWAAALKYCVLVQFLAARTSVSESASAAKIVNPLEDFSNG